MTKRIIYTNAEGGVCVVIPAGAIEGCLKDVPPGVAHDIVEAADIPADRTFRNAWEKAGAGIVHSMVKARIIAHDMRRADREAKLAPLDIEATIPARAAQAEAARQVIRDANAQMQIAIDGAGNVAGLKAALGLAA